MKSILIGIDIGTSACKAAAFNLEGKVLAQASREYNVYYPAPGFVEQNPLEWWEAVCSALQEITGSEEVPPDDIAGIGIDGQSWSAIPLDIKGNVLYNTPIWMDTRASEICRKVVDNVGSGRIFEICGNSFEPAYSTPKILWFKQHKPEIYKNTYKFLQSNSFIGYKLTNVFSQDICQGYGLHVFNMRTGSYDDGMCDVLGIQRELLPDIFQCHKVIGEVTREAACATGLKAGTPVVAGGLDAACGTLGAGVVEAGQTQEQGGQAGGMSICMDKVIPHRKLILSYHVVPDLWLLQGGTVGGGGSIKWFREQLGAYEEAREKQTGINTFKIMDEEASAIPPGSEGLVFLPYMAGERSPIWDKHASGVFFGLGYNKTRAHMIRAVMEGCAYALLHNLQTAEEAGVYAEVLNSMGGAANSKLWTQIKADVSGRMINVPASDTASTLGAALLAGVGTGICRNFREASESTMSVKRKHIPDMKAHTTYMKYYEIYLELYDKLRDTMQKSSMLEEAMTV